MQSDTAAAPESPPEMARRLIEQNTYLTLATADADGRPWASPVWFAARGLSEFFWVSRTARRHSHNIAARPEVALVVFDSTAPVGRAEAVYVDAVAQQVDEADLAAALAVYSGCSVEQGLPAWDAAAVTGDAPHRLYVARATEVFVLDETEGRVSVPVE
ncbi:putative pyridoxine 5'-phosphate oxidase superfamily flavin-nucleotide-binding protein [Agromyces hippuratus]|uniref:Putative pyridoxine 5'-phosphate oxidase superfamily flavin-nucleotide-binding protein n=1 Tax=Agromyces hippuratus TaxID=286438 RepID=A0A852WT85_9MICO|nr:pyridoxamine 5'-phosphate oxidase family protein [Agromyces hippuratus]NYG21176.1 putative pyridoxine 5'-phosphate oxidase superfamily flavin-nucleotide-binding protein [Agromyces hippuratus]